MSVAPNILVSWLMLAAVCAVFAYLGFRDKKRYYRDLKGSGDRSHSD